jgi:hypothetical protein
MTDLPLSAEDTLRTERDEYRRRWGCLACGEDHPDEVMCPPHEVRSSGIGWFDARAKKAVLERQAAERALAEARETILNLDGQNNRLIERAANLAGKTGEACNALPLSRDDIDRIRSESTDRNPQFPPWYMSPLLDQATLAITLSEERGEYRRRWGCLSCGEDHPEAVICPPHEVRSTGIGWYEARARKAILERQAAERARADARKTIAEITAVIPRTLLAECDLTEAVRSTFAEYVKTAAELAEARERIVELEKELEGRKKYEAEIVEERLSEINAEAEAFDKDATNCLRKLMTETNGFDWSYFPDGWSPDDAYITIHEDRQEAWNAADRITAENERLRSALEGERKRIADFISERAVGEHAGFGSFVAKVIRSLPPPSALAPQGEPS